jgi:hypothetical protein
MLLLLLLLLLHWCCGFCTARTSIHGRQNFCSLSPTLFLARRAKPTRLTRSIVSYQIDIYMYTGIQMRVPVGVYTCALKGIRVSIVHECRMSERFTNDQTAKVIEILLSLWKFQRSLFSASCSRIFRYITTKMWN